DIGFAEYGDRLQRKVDEFLQTHRIAKNFADACQKGIFYIDQNNDIRIISQNTDWTELMTQMSESLLDIMLVEIMKAQQNQVASISSDKTNRAKSLEATAQPTIKGEEASAPSCIEEKTTVVAAPKESIINTEQQEAPPGQQKATPPVWITLGVEEDGSAPSSTICCSFCEPIVKLFYFLH
ncbi:MAG: hypothetical protein EBU93_06535, partial [Chlamydiae bacterium]|nr:hypothetical protein [Chlamydiota bacterium]